MASAGRGRPGRAPLPYTALVPQLCCKHTADQQYHTYRLCVKFLIRKYTDVRTELHSLQVLGFQIIF